MVGAGQDLRQRQLERQTEVLVTSDDGRDVYIAFNGPAAATINVKRGPRRRPSGPRTRLLKAEYVLLRVRRRRHLERRVAFSESAVTYANNIGLAGTTRVCANRFFPATRRARAGRLLPVRYRARNARTSTSGTRRAVADAQGNLVIAYDARPPRTASSASTPSDCTDRRRAHLGRPHRAVGKEMATAPAMVSRGRGDVRMFYFQTAGGGNLNSVSICALDRRTGDARGRTR